MQIFSSTADEIRDPDLQKPPTKQEKKKRRKMPPKPDKSQEKIVADLRKLGKLEGNKTCVDCPEKMPGYINLTQKTFVCTKCSGIQ